MRERDNYWEYDRKSYLFHSNDKAKCLLSLVSSNFMFKSGIKRCS